jgi:two-component system KDP operon response regulator KdpE
MTTEPLVLAVDDERGILRLLKMELGNQGLRVATAQDGPTALQIAEQQRPDLVLLDLVVPEMDGLEIMRRLRERSSVPIILLTAKGRDEDKVRGLELGADDYIAKPFNPDELTARVRAVLRRSHRSESPGTENIVRSGDVEIDLERRLVKKDGELVSLTRTEWMLLYQLAVHAGKVMFNAELLSKVWGPEYRDDQQYLRVWISRLRGKLEREQGKPLMIKTLQGIGYMFNADSISAEPSEGADPVEAPAPAGAEQPVLST